MSPGSTSHPTRSPSGLQRVLEVPVAYFYCDRDDLAELLRVAGKLDGESVMRLRELAEELACG